MREDKLKELLAELADVTTEPVRQGLDEQITRQIPYRLIRHRVDWHSISIMIDLRLSRSIAAAAIVVTMFLWASFLGAWNTTPDQIYKDSKLLLQYGWGRENIGRDDALANLENYQKFLTAKGRKVVYYGDTADPDDRFAVLMHWRLPDGKYKVILNDLSTLTVKPGTLIALQTYMLEKQIERK